MDQQEFEEAIKEYAVKKESVIPEFQINLRTKHRILDIRTQAEKVPKKNANAINARTLITPLGRFPSVRDAAAAHARTVQWVYNQIHKGEGFTYDNKR
jgi:hypothetical protein